MRSPTLRWRAEHPSTFGGDWSYLLGRDPDNDLEPFAVVTKPRGGAWYWYGGVGTVRRNTVAEKVTFASVEAAQAHAMSWVRERLAARKAKS